ncbi:MAG: hypothetical protein CMJ78_27535 [Planctomycetaceae bacterium]|nr:hypothetical protein [Planctomycetaceae bacterium]
MPSVVRETLKISKRVAFLRPHSLREAEEVALLFDQRAKAIAYLQESISPSEEIGAHLQHATSSVRLCKLRVEDEEACVEEDLRAA